MAKNTTKRTPEQQELWNQIEVVRERIRVLKTHRAAKNLQLMDLDPDGNETQILLVARQIIFATRELRERGAQLVELETKYAMMRQEAAG